ncbi:enolase C-terminal domain-like protein [Halalkalicoccus jeotgali]|uniref:glucarate dehydratase n=1 Tax=Halalkalicoccus jeotgali (strain DSM 18796 / CECT 7217 / JCM 14584 / KCTC 4019 / B3) TaxID=795797 RepID=D8J4K9_HALJB|nr:enolase C-terminal domain-like protein [Halalkalicoccus jeotgali]ADJ13571.1 mandelate racemase/muconate lactonizing enzyme family protein [Halalkalicoccus jeotgali B3]ELY33133.1 mandelate racemase/muconate lactonizing enzyme family protein [Halalkalicoccus jeotgali B3]
MEPRITRIQSTEFSYPIEDVGTDENGFNLTYEPGAVTERKLFALQIETTEGITGEYIGGNSPAFAQINTVADYLIGKNPLHRERHWSELKRALRKYDRMGIGPLDIALWDFAGKYHDAPIHELLGTYRERLPTYASTYHADDSGGLNSPAAYADFAEECRERGFPGFKIHGWGGGDDARQIDREIATVHAVGERVGSGMDLMLDPACEYETFADALQVGKACDKQDFYWYEDPYRDGGSSQHAHRKLGEHIDTPILQTEHVRGLEPFTDFIASGATDFVRADPEYDGGITGAMKRAKIAEGFGLDVEFHAPGPAQRHCIAATRNANYYELALVHPKCDNTQPPVYLGGYSDQLDAVDPDGTVGVPDGPGLGVEYDWEYIESRALGGREYE